MFRSGADRIDSIKNQPELEREAAIVPCQEDICPLLQPRCDIEQLPSPLNAKRSVEHSGNPVIFQFLLM